MKPLIKYFWVLKSDHPATLDHKMLPVNNMDFILNFSDPITYCSAGKAEEIPRYSFTGIKRQNYTIHQAGKLNTIGVSFFSAGLHPFLKIPLSEFTNRTVELDVVIGRFNSTLDGIIGTTGSVEQQIEMLEAYFLRLISRDHVPTDEIFRLINTFNSNIHNLDVGTFCEQYGINQRKAERIFSRYIGITPKFFKRLDRFQGVLNRILNEKYDDFTSMAYENDYYDQSHFIKDFKSFTGVSPSRFMKEKSSMRQALKY
ncbi:MAG: AraC family transcriptional regulator [Desulfobacteraceae bacterium]|nr:AraC family transcriptional regulator [Desulfobacteraceae bacterium]